MIDSVSGSWRWNEVPSPSLLETSIEPPTFSILERTTSMPTPRPDTELTASAVDRPGSNISISFWRSLMRAISASL